MNRKKVVKSESEIDAAKETARANWESKPVKPKIARLEDMPGMMSHPDIRRMLGEIRTLTYLLEDVTDRHIDDHDSEYGKGVTDDFEYVKRAKKLIARMKKRYHLK